MRYSVATPSFLLTGAWNLWPDDGSRMNREVPVRFCERAGLRCSARLTILASNTNRRLKTGNRQFVGSYVLCRDRSFLAKRQRRSAAGRLLGHEVAVALGTTYPLSQSGWNCLDFRQKKTFCREYGPFRPSSTYP